MTFKSRLLQRDLNSGISVKIQHVSSKISKVQKPVFWYTLQIPQALGLGIVLRIEILFCHRSRYKIPPGEPNAFIDQYPEG